MIGEHRQQDGGALTLDHYRAAKVVMDEFGAEAEQTILRHICRLIDQDDNEGAQMWRCVLAAYDELQTVQSGVGLMH